jgi:ribosome maturation factor RimP
VELTEPFRALLEPLGLGLYDVEFAGGTLAVSVTAPEGVSLEHLTAANQAISAWLDEHDPIAGRYTLDVASPGLERRLRTPEQFKGAIGEVITLRETRGDEPTRRLEGEVLAADDATVTLRDESNGEVTVRFDHTERARTVFKWGESADARPKASAKRGR